MENIERILLIHHIAVIILTTACTIMWVKINKLREVLKNLRRIDKVKELFGDE